MRANKNFKISQIKAKDVTGNIQNVAATFGGLVVGKAISRGLDKVVKSKTVEGLVGIEVAENVAKWGKPLVVTAVGAGTVVFGSKRGNDIVKFAGLGIGAIGLSEIGTIVTGKNALAGIDEVMGDYDNIAGYNTLAEAPEYEVIDMATGEAIPSYPELALPELSGQGSGYEQVSFETPVSEAEIDLYGIGNTEDDEDEYDDEYDDEYEVGNTDDDEVYEDEIF